MHTIIHGDCLEELRKLDDNSVDAVITDPPYGLSNTKPAQVADVLKAWVTGDTVSVPAKRGGFMGADWDSFVPPPAVWAECMRVLKPGGHMAVFAGARTQDLMGLSIRLAGFEIRDTLGWIYGSGFPKSMDVSKAIDKAAGAEREVVGRTKTPFKVDAAAHRGTSLQGSVNGDFSKQVDENGYRYTEHTAPATFEARRWDGWGTALKPAIEPIILARKPLDGTVANNVLAHGVGGLNIDACRVAADDKAKFPVGVVSETGTVYGGGEGIYADRPRTEDRNPAGRFPANVLLDEHAAKEMDKQSGVLKSGGGNKAPRSSTSWFTSNSPNVDDVRNPDSGGASRFFPVFKYQAKAPKKERPVIYKNNCECEEWQSQQKDTTESTATAETSWSTSTSGNSTTEKCQQDTTSTTSTTISSTTGSKTSNALAGSTISESTQDAKNEMANGGNHAESAESLNQSEQNTGISAKRGGHSMDDAGHAISEKWYTTSECEKCGEPRLKVQHATVKPLALMEWLVSLIVPPGGVVLDPFAGSGTTLQAAVNKGFTPIGIEQDADYIQLIHQRMEGGTPSTRNS